MLIIVAQWEAHNGVLWGLRNGFYKYMKRTMKRKKPKQLHKLMKQQYTYYIIKDSHLDMDGGEGFRKKRNLTRAVSCGSE